ncbi:outer membrane beta-barrel protein [Sphingobacterium sp. SRCM116780]|uniref:outer membrane beta-barrel protein n=1 Tax=Sphingobacterium sp. SRCM116780 TaxID=2907623 RepID=UPI001F396871|nr:outer membrane beta-barrel protein [Sphingobacterium sp. SRCM116780]UIR55628.1 outer membrane beta-barrel protein [Sphingobacterium sp. SRCM116780]
MEKDKNNIDELFRKGLSNPQFEFNEEHWKNMQVRLDKTRTRKKAKQIFILIVSAAAIATLFFIWNSNRSISDSEIDNSIQEIVKSSPIKKQKEEVVNGSSSPIEKRQEKENKQSQLEDTFTENLEIKNNLKTWRQDAFIDVVDLKNKAIQRSFLRTISIPKMKGNIKSTYSSNLQSESLETNERKPATIIAETIFAPPNLQEKERSVLSVLAGPDLSSVRGSGTSSLSENIGVLYSYPVIKGLSLSLGATYAKKNYKSSYNLYSPANPPQLTQLPSQVHAECDVIDIPLTANYTILKNKKLKFNVSAGLSSYFMLKEKYTFDYDGEGSYGNQKSAVYEVNGENQHIFGIADFSISIEKKINDKINVGIKPFVKMPLTGIGYGRVALESKGVAFMLGVSL